MEIFLFLNFCLLCSLLSCIYEGVRRKGVTLPKEDFLKLASHEPKGRAFSFRSGWPRKKTRFAFAQEGILHYSATGLSEEEAERFEVVEARYMELVAGVVEQRLRGLGTFCEGD